MAVARARRHFRQRGGTASAVMATDPSVASASTARSAVRGSLTHAPSATPHSTPTCGAHAAHMRRTYRHVHMQRTCSAHACVQRVCRAHAHHDEGEVGEGRVQRVKAREVIAALFEQVAATARRRQHRRRRRRRRRRRAVAATATATAAAAAARRIALRPEDHILRRVRVMVAVRVRVAKPPGIGCA